LLALIEIVSNEGIPALDIFIQIRKNPVPKYLKLLP